VGPEQLVYPAGVAEDEKHGCERPDQRAHGEVRRELLGGDVWFTRSALLHGGDPLVPP
jgi:hypothetical protein